MPTGGHMSDYENYVKYVQVLNDKVVADSVTPMGVL